MWKKIDPTIMRALSGIVFDIWGGVGFQTEYNAETKEIELTIWDKSYKMEDKQVVVDKKFKYDLSHSDEYKAKAEIIAMIEKYLIESYT